MVFAGDWNPKALVVRPDEIEDLDGVIEHLTGNVHARCYTTVDGCRIE
jgi:hypothetical protein